MVSRREATQDALYAWRQAERELANSTDGRRAELEADIVRYRAEYQRLYSEHMIESLDRLHEAEDRGGRPRARPGADARTDFSRNG